MFFELGDVGLVADEPGVDARAIDVIEEQRTDQAMPTQDQLLISQRLAVVFVEHLVASGVAVVLRLDQPHRDRGHVAHAD